MADRVKVYEETKKKGVPIWAWLIPLLILIAIIIYFATRHPAAQATAAAPPAAAAAAPTNAFPDLGTVHFNTNQATLTPDGEATLRRAAGAMKANPNLHLRLEGFTDSTGSLPHNASLSDRRTFAVANFLKAQGVEGSRLTGQGFGPADPAATNATEQGKADNRRVELFSQK